MKNTCKRLFSLMLAVVLLVSVVPFQASAVERTDSCFIDVLGIGEEGYHRMYLEEGYLSAADVDYIKVVAIQQGIPAVLDIPGVGEMKIDDLQYYDFIAHGVFEGAYKYAEGYGINAEMADNGTTEETPDDGGKEETPDPIDLSKYFVDIVGGPFNNSNYARIHITSSGYPDADDIAAAKNAAKKLGEKLIGITVNGQDCLFEKGMRFDGSEFTDAVQVGDKFGINVAPMFAKNNTDDDKDDNDDKDDDNDNDHNGQVKEYKMTFQVKYNGTIYTATNYYKEGKVVELTKNFVKDMIGEAYDNYNDNRSAYTFKGVTHEVGDKVTMNGNRIVTFQLTKNTANPPATGTGKDKHEAFLKIYTWDGSRASTAQLAKSPIPIWEKDQIGWDGDVEWDELKREVRKYFSAKDSDGIQYDGMYIENGSNIYNWLTDSNKFEDGIFDLDERREKNTVYISVFISNATKKSSSNNSDNPKTGDEIFMTVTVMAVSATALACVYFFNKKRMAK